MDTAVKKRSIVIGGHKTSISLEDSFWSCLKEIANARTMNLSELVGLLDSERQNGNLSSAIRVFVLDHYRTMADTHSQQPRRSGAYEARYT